MTHEETTQFTVLELWPGIYVQEIGNDFEWEWGLYVSNDKPESFAVTNDLQKAKKLSENYNAVDWKTALLSAFPNAKIKNITVTIKTTIGEGHTWYEISR